MELIEDTSVPDVFINGTAKIERLSGGLIRLSYYTERRNFRGEMEYVLVLRVVRSIESMSQSLKMTSMFMSRSDMPMVAEGGMAIPMDS